MSRKPSKRRQRPAPHMPIVLRRRPLRALLLARTEDDRAVAPEAAQMPAERERDIDRGVGRERC